MATAEQPVTPMSNSSRYQIPSRGSSRAGTPLGTLGSTRALESADTQRMQELTEKYQALMKEHTQLKEACEDQDRRMRDLEHKNNVLMQQTGEVSTLEKRLALQSAAGVDFISAEESTARTAIETAEGEEYTLLLKFLLQMRRADKQLQDARSALSTSQQRLNAAVDKGRAAEGVAREMEHRVASLTEDLHDSRNSEAALKRALHTMEQKVATLEAAVSAATLDKTTALARAEGEVADLKSEREMLLRERGSLLREKDTLLQIQTYNTDCERTIRGYKEVNDQLNRELSALRVDLNNKTEDLEQTKALLTEKEDNEDNLKSTYNQLAQGLRHEIMLLQNRLQEAEGEKEVKLQADMEAMLSMQTTAMERDTLMLKMRDEVASLREKYDALAKEKAIILDKLVLERAKVEELQAARPLESGHPFVERKESTCPSPRNPTRVLEEMEAFENRDCSDPVDMSPEDAGLDDVKGRMHHHTERLAVLESWVLKRKTILKQLKEAMHKMLRHEFEALGKSPPGERSPEGCLTDPMSALSSCQPSVSQPRPSPLPRHTLPQPTPPDDPPQPRDDVFVGVPAAFPRTPPIRYHPTPHYHPPPPPPPQSLPYQPPQSTPVVSAPPPHQNEAVDMNTTLTCPEYKSTEEGLQALRRRVQELQEYQQRSLESASAPQHHHSLESASAPQHHSLESASAREELPYRTSSSSTRLAAHPAASSSPRSASSSSTQIAMEWVPPTHDPRSLSRSTLSQPQQTYYSAASTVRPSCGEWTMNITDSPAAEVPSGRLSADTLASSSHAIMARLLDYASGCG